MKYKMKALASIKYFGGIASLLFMLSACQKALNNTVPEGTPRRQFYNNQIINCLTNDSVWITQKLDKNSLTFKVGFDFKKDKTVTLYLLLYKFLTLIEELNIAKITFTSPRDLLMIDRLIEILSDPSLSDSDARFHIIKNPRNANILNAIQKYFPVTLIGPIKEVKITETPNTFDVQGDFNSSLTFFSNSFLSELKRTKNFDFDFLINSYNRDSIVMTSYYSQPNNIAVLKPVASTSIVPHFNAIGIINILPFASEIRINGKILAGETVTHLKNKFSDSYDNLNKNLNFVVKATETEHPEFKGLTALKVIETPYKIGDPKPAAGTVLAKFIAYNPSVKGFNNSIPVEVLVK